MNSTNDRIPPSYWNTFSLRPSSPPRSSLSTIFVPALRNANSLNLKESVSKLKSSVSKISGSGRNLIVVPVVSAGPFTSSGATVAPRLNA
ncbi:MAG: hypothetical protein BWY92_01875 [Firmicutes bacterium ADurb.BinA052]|nr:MAG: hypothetical protein BWY92_01875 [Firmicutes bacterium ADurb.BinA052]